MDPRDEIEELKRRLAAAEALLDEKADLEAVLRESEARHRLLISSWTQAVWDTDADGVVVADSPSWRAYTGQTLEEWLGYGWLDAIHPDDRAYAERQWRDAIAARGLVDAEFRLRAPDGGWRWTNVRAAPVLDANGDIEKWAGMNIDVDVRKRAEAALRESEARYRTLFDSIDEGFCIADRLPVEPPDFLYTATNPAFERQTGLRDAVGRTMRELVPSVDEAPLEMHARVAETGRSEGMETYVAELDRWFEAESAATGRSGQVAVLFRDITARKRAEHGLQESEERQTILLALSDALRPLTDAADIREAAATVLGEHLGASRVAYAEDLGDDGSFVVFPNYVRGATDMAGAFHYADFGAGLLAHLRAGDNLVQPDLARDARLSAAERKTFADAGIGASMNVPLVKGGRLVAFLGINYPRAHDFSPREIALARETAERTWAAVERASAEAALQRSQERQRFLLRLSDTLRPIADPEEVQFTATRLVGEYLDVDRVFYAQIEPGSDHVTIGRHYARGVAEMSGRHPIGDDPTAVDAALRAGRTVVVSDVLTDPTIDAGRRAAQAAMNVRAFVGVPMVKSGRPHAYLGVHRAEPHRWTRDEVSLLEEVAERSWEAIARARIEAALRRSEERLAAAFESVPFGIAVIDLDGRVVIANEGYRRFLPSGVIPSRDPERGDRWHARDAGGYRIAPSDFPGARALRGERVVPGQDMLYTDDDGREIWTNVSAVPIRAARGEVTSVATVIADVDVLRRSTEALRESEERQAFLLRLSDELRAAPNDALLPRAIGLLADELHLDLCYVVTVRTDENRANVVCQLRRGDMPGVPDVIRLSDYPKALLRWLDSTLVSDDMASDPGLSEVDRRNVTAMRFGGLIAAPVRRGAGNPIWSIVAVAARPRHWTAGEIALVEDVAERTWAAAERAEAEAALQASEQRFRQFGEASSDVLWIVDAATGRLEYLSPAFDRMWGVPRATVMADMSRWVAMLHPDDRGQVLTAMPRAIAGETVLQEYRIVRSDGAVRYITDVGFPIFGDDGRVVRVGGIAQDLTERRQIEAAVRASEQQLQLLMEGVQQLVWRAADNGRWTWASPQWTGFTGQAEVDSHGSGWLEPVHPDDREGVLLAWENAIERGEFYAEHRLFDVAAQRYSWFQTRASPVRDDGGAIVEWLGTSTDVDDLRQLQSRQGVMVAELQHRTRNLITVVKAIAQQTLRQAGSLPDFGRHFRDRLEALSRVQGLLSQLAAGKRVTFDELLGSELAALGAPSGKVTLAGPAGVPLRSAMVQTFSLALHQLATNALKYGALVVEGGHLAVRWSVSSPREGEDPRLHVDWRETGVDLTQVGERPRGGGYGRELIENALPYQLGATTTYEMAADGVHCTIDVPVAATRADGPPA